MPPRRLATLSCLLAALVTAAAPAPGRAADEQDLGWVITAFDVRLDLRRDGALDVTETIRARFDVPKHGIFREIPVRYAVGSHLYDIRFRLRGVTDGAGEAWAYRLRDEENKVVLRIGRADLTLTGEQTYVLRYRVSRAVLWEGEHAVLRWNATGTEWRVPIVRSTVTVVLPEPLDEARVQADAWTGRFGAIGKDFTKERVDASTWRFATGGLGPGEGITVEVAVPESVVVRPSLATRLGWWLADNFPYGLVPLGLAAAFGAWYLRGRDLPGRGTVVVQYQPPDGLRPAEVGTLADERVDLRDISATIIDLAVRGYVSIEERTTAGLLGLGSSTDYTFRALKPPEGLKGYEADIHRRLFRGRSEVDLSDLKNVFYKTLPGVKDDLYRGLALAGYFDGRPDRVRLKSLLLGLLATAIALGAAAALQHAWIGRVFPVPLIVSGVALAAIAVATSWAMPRRTSRGRIAWEQIRGLEEYISRAEVDDLKEQERRNVFERLLPYAIAFGATTRWAKAFEGLYAQPPDWFRTAGPGPFTMGRFGSSIDRSVGALNATLPSQPRSQGGGGGGWSSGGFSGGGSSGGGFGGGGGGSW